MPRFSVVIAAFNAARWIVSTVSSALAQTHGDREIIVVGDACTDETGAVLESNFGSAIQWRNLERNSGGQSYPNNEGIRISSGTHIAYLGHDDIWSPRHLQQLADVIGAHDPDFAVSGAIFHGPPGSRYYQITGMFENPATAEREFFPPSSFAHRRDVIDRIGSWRDPNTLRAPADCDFLLRAVALKCTFASTRNITVHKFAAGHRYLSYRVPSGEEQARMLDRLGTEDGEAQVLQEVEKDIADGADNLPIRYFDFDRFAAGDLYRRNRSTKGLEKTPPVLVDQPRWFPVGPFPAGLDWYELEEGSLLGSFRWSGPSPNPRYLLNVRVAGAVQLRIHVLAFAETDLAESLKLEINSRDAAFARDRNPAGTHVLKVEPIGGPIDDALVLRFRLPRCVHLRHDPRARRVGLALSGIEVLPLP